MIGYIYSLINTTNGKRYVGKTLDINRRLQRHWTELKKNTHHSHKLQRAFNKYGASVFKVEVEEYNIESDQELSQKEIEAIEKYNSYHDGYNETFGGDGNTTVFDYKTAAIIYQIGQKYDGVIHKLANYYNCDRTTISNIFSRDSLKTLEYSEKEMQKVILAANITLDNLKENYQDNYTRKLSEDQVLKILSVIEIKKYSQSACAKVFNVKKDIVGGIIQGKTYKKDVEIFKTLSQKEKEELSQWVCDNTEIEKIHYQGQRGAVKNPLTQKQVDYILDNIGIKTQVQISKDLGISKDRVGSVKNHKSYLDLINDYEKRHSSK